MEQSSAKAAEKIRDTAAELLDIYARRAARKGFQFDDPDENYKQFAASFPLKKRQIKKRPSNLYCVI